MAITPLGAVVGGESRVPGLSWGPVIGGAVAAAATTLILLLVGSGLGLTMVSPWSFSASASATTFAVSAVIWLVLMQWISSFVGGYLTGRLRTRWVGLHDDEVYFRDTAHGFLSWALATLVVTTLAASHIASAVGAGAQAASNVAAGAAMGASAGAAANADEIADSASGAGGYFVDTLFRPAAPAGGATAAPASAGQPGTAPETQATRILANGALSGELPAEDKTYLAQLVSQRTGLAQADAEKRVDTVLGQIEAAKTKAKEAADTARKAGVTVSLLSALALVVGAFIASVAALVGGRHRDDLDTLP